MYVRRYIVYNQSVNNINSISVYISVCDTLQNGTTGWLGGGKLLNKVVIFVFFAHEKYSRSFVKLWLNRWWHMDYFNDVLAMFLSLDRVRILAVYESQRALGFHQKYLNLCSEDERRSYGFGTTWGWVLGKDTFKSNALQYSVTP